jgi:hypothetical protein
LITLVDHEPPDITCPPDILINCSESTDPAFAGSASASDMCDAAPTVTYTDVTTAGSCPQELSITRTWMATDSCGNSITCEQIITVIDTTAPIITCPADITIECTASTDTLNTGSATATDNCVAASIITFSDITVGGSCPQEGTITRTWTATDSCGNSSTCNQIITINDSQPPVITCPPNITLQCTDTISIEETGWQRQLIIAIPL